MQAEREEMWRTGALPIIYRALGRQADADAALAEMIAKYEKDSPYGIAGVMAERGEADRAFAWLEKALDCQDAGLSGIATPVRQSQARPALAAAAAQAGQGAGATRQGRIQVHFAGQRREGDGANAVAGLAECKVGAGPSSRAHAQ